ncbi:MAG: hypothetical protein IBJ07_06085 [Rhizobiaceae bacterium]|nr:hypothetical protein [Rhizobiaceae bacterium]
MMIFEGERTAKGVVVTVDGSPLPDTATDLPGSGFEWGYGGPEPLRLAHALLAACFGPAIAVRYREKLLAEEVALLENWWQLTAAELQAAIDVQSILGKGVK